MTLLIVLATLVMAVVVCWTSWLATHDAPRMERVREYLRALYR